MHIPRAQTGWPEDRFATNGPILCMPSLRFSFRSNAFVSLTPWHGRDGALG